MLNNLLSNAIKFSPAFSTIQVSGAVQMKTQTEGRITIRVIDYGHGVNKVDFKAIFEPYYRHNMQR